MSSTKCLEDGNIKSQVMDARKTVIGLPLCPIGVSVVGNARRPGIQNASNFLLSIKRLVERLVQGQNVEQQVLHEDVREIFGALLLRDDSPCHVGCAGAECTSKAHDSCVSNICG